MLLALGSMGTAAPLLGHFPPSKPAGFGMSLAAVYVVTLLLVVVLAFGSRAYAL